MYCLTIYDNRLCQVVKKTSDGVVLKNLMRFSNKDWSYLKANLSIKCCDERN